MADVNGYRVRCYVAPCWVDQVADRLEAAGFQVDVRGTEHVHYRAPYVDGWGGLSACDAAAEATGLPMLGNERNWTIINTY
jgi:hypothetical protein